MFSIHGFTRIGLACVLAILPHILDAQALAPLPGWSSPALQPTDRTHPSPPANTPHPFRALGSDADGMVHAWVKADPAALEPVLQSLGGRIKYAASQQPERLAVAIPEAQWRSLATHPVLKAWHGTGPAVRPLGDIMLMRSRVDSVHLGAAPLPQAYTGKGVVVGLIDIGIDVWHPDLRDSLGRTRVKWVWDQTLPVDGTEPMPYGYGQTCDSAALEAMACNHEDPWNFYSHGTGATGIAAGNGLGLGRYTGVAPEADIVAVNTLFGNSFTSNVADAVRFIFDYAASVGKPCVINTSVGTYLGSHDGTDAVAREIDAMLSTDGIEPGRAVVAAVGNGGDIPHHLRHAAGSDTTFSWFEYVPALGAAYMQGWIDTADARGFHFSLGANNSATYAEEAAGPWLNLHADFSPAGAAFDSTAFGLGPAGALGEAQVWVQRQGPNFFVELVVLPDSTDRLWRLESTGDGPFDVWSDLGLIGSSHILRGSELPDAGAFPDIVRYTETDFQQTLVSSWQCSDRVITVGSYYNRDTMTNYYGANPPISGTPGTRIASSSSGPTRDGRIKPDISASGQWVLAAASDNNASFLIGAGAATYIAQGGLHYLQGGTSFSSPIVCGAAALYLERYPTADWRAIKEALLQGARGDAFTGTDLPDFQWGYGKLNAFAMLQVSDDPCAVPANVQVTHVYDTVARITWDPVPDATAYRLEGRKIGTDRWVTRGSLSLVEIVPNLRPATDYEFRMRALCGIVDTSGWTGLVPFTTLSAKAAATLGGELESGYGRMAPNPVRTTAQLQWDFSQSAGADASAVLASWELFDALGRRQVVLPLEGLKGRQDWDRGALPTGSYIYRYRVNGHYRDGGVLQLQ